MRIHTYCKCGHLMSDCLVTSNPSDEVLKETSRFMCAKCRRKKRKGPYMWHGRMILTFNRKKQKIVQLHG
jgi:hypothetical protein